MNRAVGALLILVGGFAYGVVATQHRLFPCNLLLDDPAPPDRTEQPPPRQPGNPTPKFSIGAGADGQRPERTAGGKFYRVSEWIQRRAADRETITDTPYQRGVQAAPALGGVTVYDEARAQDGVNLVLSGHGPEATLCDMKGRVLHRWKLPFEKVWPGPLGFKEFPVHKTFWRRVHALPDGSLLAIFEGIGMIKVDADSQLVWQHKGRCHHDISIGDDGRIYTLAHHERALNESMSILDDSALVLSPDGEELQRVSLLDAFMRSRFAGHLRDRDVVRDFMHTNTAQLLRGRLADEIPAFAAGNVLLSMRNLDMIAVLDLQRGRIAWAMTGLWGRQHQPQVLENGHILLFDNVGDERGSKVIELDPLTQRIPWSYQGTPEQPFVSANSGSCQRLANGNTLIVESVSGRAFEVTPAKEIVWEFLNPNREGEQGELIAVLYDVVRLDWGYFDAFPALAEKRAQVEREVDLGGVDELLEGRGK